MLGVCTVIWLLLPIQTMGELFLLWGCALLALLGGAEQDRH